MKSIDVIIPSVNTPVLDSLCIRSFEKFRPKDISVRYIVVENSPADGYKKEICGLGDVVWVQNNTGKTETKANADGLRVGAKYAKSEYLFFAHCDTFVTSPLFYTVLKAYAESGHKLVGTVLYENKGMSCYHVSGLLVHRELIEKVDLMAQTIDACDELTFYCRANNIKMYCFPNTFNGTADAGAIKEKYRKIRVDRCVYKGEVIFMHLGRGVPKTRGKYSKPGRCLLPQWVAFCKGML